MLRNPVVQSSPAAALGRRRTVNLKLPLRMARKGDSYYYVTNDKPRKWIALGSDLTVALRRWADIHADYETGRGPPGLSVGDLVNRYIDTQAPELAPGTIKQYRSFQRALDDAFPGTAASLKSAMVARWRDHPDQRARRIYVQGCIAVLRAAYVLGCEQGVVPQPITVRPGKPSKRDRYLTDDEYRAIREKAPEWLRVMMDLGYLTALRRSDLLGLLWANVSDDALTIRQQKTRMSVAFTMTEDLSAVLSTARKRRIVGLHIISKSNGRPVGVTTFDRAWKAACVVAGVEDAHFHDIRGKAATDAKAGGQDYQKLLGHANPAMSERYIKRRETVIAEPVRKKL